MKKLYFDNSATTSVYPEVVREMNNAMIYDYGNPSSNHAFGDKSQKLLLSARTKLARAIGSKVHELYFTSGTTESNNWVLQGLARNYPSKKKIIISSIEHPSIRETCEYLKSRGYFIVELPVDSFGFIDLKFLEKNIDSNTLVVSVMQANNIFGTIQNLKKIGDLCKRKKVLFHTDCAQSFTKMKILVHDWNIDLLSASAHKIGGPKGVGFLYIRDGIAIAPLFFGGGQEKRLRSGTENVPAIVGFAKACEISLKKDWTKISEMRDLLIDKLRGIGGKLVGARGISRLSNNIFVTFSGMNAEDILYKLSEKEIYVSIGSACDSKKEKEDSALKAIGLSSTDMKSSLRISLPADVTKKDIEYFVNVLRKLI
ncbi:cysteine desulfurase [Candidatus Pacearchaeota archaeon]|nr:cysteine desulfurase [Candidatus Pacearchaeota archaeon]